MKILQISSAKNFGGGERHLIDLCEGLHYDGGEKKRSRSKDGRNEIFVVLRAGNNWQEKLSFLPQENIIHLPLKNSFDIFSVRTLAKIIREKNIEIVHAHLARDYPIAALAAQLSKKAKLVLTRHLLFPLNSLHRFVLPKDAMFIAVSESVRREILNQKVLTPEQIKLIYNGVDTRHFANAGGGAANKENLRQQLNLKSDSQLVGIVGEITVHKGQTDFVRAASTVLKQIPKAEFLIVGQDSSPQKKHRKNLENLIKELDLENKIHLLGWLDDVAPVIGALDVFVSASLVEPFGLVIAEAMAAGCAVVATETDGAGEIIEKDKNGKIVSIGDSIELAKVIVQLLSDDNLRKTLGEKAQQTASEKFDVERMVVETEKIYREILRQNIFDG